VDAPRQPRGRQCSQHVGDGLVGHRAEIVAHETDVAVRIVVHRGPRTRDAQGSPRSMRWSSEVAGMLRSVPQILE
jgi:hypothetical protein